MSLSCGVVRDLLPLYAEKLTGDESNQLIEEHLSGCAECSGALAALQSGGKKELSFSREPAPLKLVREDIRRRRLRTSVFASLVVFLLLFTLFSYLTRPVYFSCQDSGVEISETESHSVYANFSGAVTACRIVTWPSDNGSVVKEVEAWTSAWDKLLGTATPAVLLAAPGEKTDTVYYCSNTERFPNLTVIYGRDPSPNGGGAVLPRLFLGFYFLFAAAAAAVIGLAWLLLRKNGKLRRICKYLFFVPASYLAGHGLLATRFASFSATRDFLMNLIAAAAIYGICILGISLAQQRRADRAL